MALGFLLEWINGAIISPCRMHLWLSGDRLLKLNWFKVVWQLRPTPQDFLSYGCGGLARCSLSLQNLESSLALEELLLELVQFISSQQKVKGRSTILGDLQFGFQKNHTTGRVYLRIQNLHPLNNKLANTSIGKTHQKTRQLKGMASEML